MKLNINKIYSSGNKIIIINIQDKVAVDYKRIIAPKHIQIYINIRFNNNYYLLKNILKYHKYIIYQINKNDIIIIPRNIIIPVYQI
jgi:hypothetical protein